MKRLFKSLKLQTLTAFIFVLSSCSSTDSSPIPEVPGAPTVSGDETVQAIANDIKFNLYTKKNTPIELTYEPNTIYCSFATWCGYSRKFAELLTLPVYKRITEQYNFVFIVHKIEIDDILKQIKEDQEMTEAEKKEALAKLKEMRKTQDEIDPSALADLPGKFYFFHDDFNREIGSFPSAYNPSSDKFDANPLTLLAALNPENIELIKQMLIEYNQESETHN